MDSITLGKSHARKDRQRNHHSPGSHDWLFRQSENRLFSSGKPHVCDRPPVSRCEEARLTIRHFAQLTKRIAKCRKRNPASRILLRAICVAQINAVRCGKEATPPRSASGRVPHAACVRRIARRHSAGKGLSRSAIVGPPHPCRPSQWHDQGAADVSATSGWVVRRGGVRALWKELPRSVRRIRERRWRGGRSRSRSRSRPPSPRAWHFPAVGGQGRADDRESSGSGRPRDALGMQAGGSVPPCRTLAPGGSG